MLTFWNPSPIIKVIPFLDKVLLLISWNLEVLIGLLSALVAIYLPLWFSILDKNEDSFSEVDKQVIRDQDIFNLKTIISLVSWWFGILLFRSKDKPYQNFVLLLVFLIITGFLIKKCLDLYNRILNSEYKVTKRLDFLINIKWKNRREYIKYRNIFFSKPIMDSEQRYLDTFWPEINKWLQSNNQDNLDYSLSLLKLLNTNFENISERWVRFPEKWVIYQALYYLALYEDQKEFWWINLQIKIQIKDLIWKWIKIISEENQPYYNLTIIIEEVRKLILQDKEKLEAFDQDLLLLLLKNKKILQINDFIEELQHIYKINQNTFKSKTSYIIRDYIANERRNSQWILINEKPNNENIEYLSNLGNIIDYRIPEVDPITFSRIFILLYSWSVENAIQMKRNFGQIGKTFIWGFDSEEESRKDYENYAYQLEKNTYQLMDSIYDLKPKVNLREKQLKEFKKNIEDGDKNESKVRAIQYTIDWFKKYKNPPKKRKTKSKTN